MATVRPLVPGDEAAIDGFLAARVESSLLLRSNLEQAGLADDGAPFQGTYVGAFEGARLIGLAAHYWNGNLILQAPAAADVVARAAVAASGRRLKGLLGPWDQVSAARVALGVDVRPAQHDTKEILYTLPLEGLRTPAPLAAGAVVCRASAEHDLPRLLDWRMAYAAEALGSSDDARTRGEEREGLARAHAESRLFVLCEAGAPVATCTVIAKTRNMVLLGGVCTPLPLRRRGHGRAVVAGTLLAAKGAGARTGVLFTATTNAASNRVYESLGFVPIGDYGLVLFGEEVASAACGVAFRAAVAGDFDYCARLYFAPMEEMIRSLKLDRAAHAADFRRRWAVEEVRIITRNGADVGWLQSRLDSQSFFLGQLFVDTPCRNQGIGTAVMLALIGEAGRRALTLGVIKTNPARRLYARLGFCITHEDERKFYMRRSGI